ncbi:MAG: methyltransferase domain-containing protein [Deltaproteobacteria bacterium]|nr:methyltransferase domain-containing protein [Deltaproteobacteria bacterium]
MTTRSSQLGAPSSFLHPFEFPATMCIHVDHRMDLVEIPSGQFARHPWESSRRDFFARLLVDNLAMGEIGSVLDAGAGDGWFLSELAPVLRSSVELTCWDLNYTISQIGELEAQHPGGRFTAETPRGPFGLALALDVIEHVEDDVGFLRGLVGCLRPRGWILVSVPAWQQLYGPHDARLKHFRRYSPAQLTDAVRSADLDNVKQGGLFHGLLLARVATRALEFATSKNETQDLGTWNKPTWITKVVHSALVVEGRISARASDHGVALPGLSAWALCRKR